VLSEHPKHPGRKLFRLALESFELLGKKGPHSCIVHEPLGLPMADVRQMVGGKLPAYFLQPMIYGMLVRIDFLHSAAHVVHTGKLDRYFGVAILLVCLPEPQIFKRATLCCRSGTRL
jgi:hypothetical protein